MLIPDCKRKYVRDLIKICNCKGYRKDDAI